MNRRELLRALAVAGLGAMADRLQAADPSQDAAPDIKPDEQLGNVVASGNLMGSEMAAGLSAAHLSALVLPRSLCRLYLLRELDASGAFVEERLGQRCREAGIEMLVLTSIAKDLNIDLCEAPAPVVKARIVPQLAPEDRIRFAV